MFEALHCMAQRPGHLRKLKRKYLQSSEIWCWRRIDKIKWSEKVTNEVLEHIGEEKRLLNNIQHRKGNWFGHILGSNCLLHDVI